MQGTVDVKVRMTSSNLRIFALLIGLMSIAVGAHATEAKKPEHPTNRSATPLIHPGIFLTDVELHSWQRDWYSSAQAKDCDAVDYHLRQAKAADDPAALALEGVMLRDGLCRKVNIDAASANFLDAIRMGEVAPMVGLAWLHMDRSKEEALRWFQKAFLIWAPLPPWKRDAEFLKSGLYFPPGMEAPDWVADEYQRISHLAIQGSEAMLATADNIEAGRAFIADSQTACLWRLAAAKGPSATARLALAQQLYEGRGVPQRLNLAAKWFYEASLEGNANAMARLGEIMIDGSEGLEANPRGAVILLARAEAAGIDVGDAMRAARVKLGEPRADSALRSAVDGPLPVPRIQRDAQGKECW